jgi:hypothetical protein
MHQTCHKVISVSDSEYGKLGNGLLWKKFNKEYGGEMGVKSWPNFYGAFSTIIEPETLHLESIMKVDLMGTYINERDPVKGFWGTIYDPTMAHFT